MPTTLLSPGVQVNEFDLTTGVASVSTSTGAIAGLFHWGPVNQRILIPNEDALVRQYLKPSNLNAETFFTAANFLAYSNQLYVVRVANTTYDVVSNTASFWPNTVTGSGTSGAAIDIGSNPTTLGFNVGVRVKYDVVDYQPTIGGLTDDGIYYITASNATHISLGLTAGGANLALTNLTTTSKTKKHTIRIDDAYSNGAYNAFAGLGTGGEMGNIPNNIVLNRQDYLNKFSSGGSASGNTLFIAKYPGEMGNSLRISVCDSPNAYSSNVNLVSGNNAANTYVNASATMALGSNILTLVFTSPTGNIAAANAQRLAVQNDIAGGDLFTIGNTSLGLIDVKVNTFTGTSNSSQASITITCFNKNTLKTAYTANTSRNGNSTNVSVKRRWEYFNLVDHAPTQSNYVNQYGNTAAVDGMHIVVIDNLGRISGTVGTVLERFTDLSRATDAKTDEGTSIYYKNVLNDQSAWVWWANDRTNATSANALMIATSGNDKPFTQNFAYGSDGVINSSNMTLDIIGAGYDLFKDKEEVDVSLILQGKPVGNSTTVINDETVTEFDLANYIIDNIVETRKDCVAFITPPDSLITSNLTTPSNMATSLVNWAGAINDTTYAVIDSGYKYQYDKYNDLYRYVPLNGDIAGLCARTDQTNDPWWSPAGFNRGKIKNVVRLRWNPDQTSRDTLYKNSVNPIVSFPADGPILFGDKTATTKTSAFSNINVRRLFITLEKAISRAAKSYLFEFNDEFTRSQFKNLVVPYLRDVQGRRGITDFLVVCDATNNTPEVIDRNEFIGDIYIKPARSINFIQLNFVAVRTGVEFSTITGFR